MSKSIYWRNIYIKNYLKIIVTHTIKYKAHNINNIENEKIEEYPNIYKYSKSLQINQNHNFNYNFDNKEEFEEEKYLTFYNNKINKKLNNNENPNEIKNLNKYDSSRVKNSILEISFSEFTNNFCSSKMNNNYSLNNEEKEKIDFKEKKK